MAGAVGASKRDGTVLKLKAVLAVAWWIMVIFLAKVELNKPHGPN